MADEGLGSAAPDASGGAALPAPVRRLRPLLGAAITLLALGWAADLPTWFDVALYIEQVLAAILAFALADIYLTCRAGRRKPAGAPPWYDIAAACLGFATACYVAVRYPVLAEEMFYRPTETFIVGSILVVLVTEALRRTIGWSLVVIFLLFVVYALFGHLVPGELQGRSQPFYRLMALLGLDGGSLFGTPISVVVNIVIAFIFMGQLLLASGGADFFNDLAAALMGGSRGGSAKITIVSSALFGTISGSAVANVASSGIVTIPLMHKSGYRPHVAAAIEAVSSTAGQITPPVMGAAAFLMAEFLQVPYSEIAIAAAIPAALYYIALFIQTDLEAGRTGMAALPREEIPSLLRVMREGWFFVIPFAVLILALFEYNMPPEKAALYSSFTVILSSLVFGHGSRRLRLRDIGQALASTGYTVTEVIVICGVAGMIIGILNLTGLGFGLTFVLIQLGEGNLLLLLAVTAIVCIILGMSMPTVSLYILLSALVAPPLIELGVQPLAAHMFVFYFGLMSMITPPVALAAYTAANIAGADPVRTGLSSLRLGWTAYIVPFLFVFSPSLLAQGSVLAVSMAFITAIAGVWLASAGIVGQFLNPLAVLPRVGLFAAGVSLLLPAGTFDGAVYVEIAGAVLGALLIGRELTVRRRALARGTPG